MKNEKREKKQKKSEFQENKRKKKKEKLKLNKNWRKERKEKGGWVNKPINLIFIIQRQLSESEEKWRKKRKEKKVERKAVLEGKKGNFIFSFGIYFGWLGWQEKKKKKLSKILLVLIERKERKERERKGKEGKERERRKKRRGKWWERQTQSDCISMWWLQLFKYWFLLSSCQLDSSTLLLEMFLCCFAMVILDWDLHHLQVTPSSIHSSKIWTNQVRCRSFRDIQTNRIRLSPISFPFPVELKWGRLTTVEPVPQGAGGEEWQGLGVKIIFWIAGGHKWPPSKRIPAPQLRFVLVIEMVLMDLEGKSAGGTGEEIEAGWVELLQTKKKKKGCHGGQNGHHR